MHLDNLKFGIIGTGAITKRFIKGANKVTGVEVCAVCSRSMKQAIEYASQYAGMQAFDQINDLFQHVDAVYIATPNYTHKENIIQALMAKKHVLCEKPMLLTKQDVQECFALAKQQGCLLMEAMKPCFLPTTLQAKAWIEAGKIGTLRYLEGGYCSDGVEAFQSGWHSEIEKGGGALYDLGVYPIAFANCIDTTPIVSVQATSRCLENGIDAMWGIQITYEDGVIAQLRCAVDTPTQNVARLYGDQGYIEIENFWKSDKAVLHTSTEEIIFHEPHEQSEFQYQIAAFLEAIQTNASQQAIMDEHASARNAGVVDQLKKIGG